MDIKLDIYNEECLSLANSMYLKFDLHALAVERWYRKSSNVGTDRTEWLHYKNLAGIYHDYNEVMTVKSLDTLEEITFSKEVLADHPTTLALYREFGTYYRNLVNKYPDNHTLIHGILYGRDIENVIAMDDFHIVGWNTNLVEVQEYNLIPELNQRLSIMGTRAGSPNYVEVDKLYPLAIMANVTSNLPQLIKLVRFKNSKRYSANTFYIWSRINSVINLEQYKNYLDYNDMMYLFKNIVRLKNGRCSKDVFMEVLQTIITPKMIDAYYLESNTDVSTMNIENRVVEAEWTQKDILSGAAKETTLNSVISDHISRSNYAINNPDVDLTTRLAEDWNTNSYPELILYDNRETEGDVRELGIRIDYAFLYAGLGLINNYYEITIPDTGANVTLSYPQWLIVWQRIQQLRYGKVTETIPSYVTGQLYSHSGITLLGLIEYGLDQAAAQKIIDIIGDFPSIRNNTADTTSYIDNYISTRSTVTSIISRGYNKTNNIYIGGVNGVIFSDYSIALEPTDTNFLDWLDDIGLDMSSMSSDTLTQLEYNILTGVLDISSDAADALVNSMGQLLNKFISYKTNISRKKSDTITLSLSSRPNWVSVGVDLSPLANFVNVHSSLESTPLTDVDTRVDLTMPDLDTRITSSLPDVDINNRSYTVTGNIGNLHPIINLRPTTLVAEILE